MSSMEQRSVKCVYQGRCSADITSAVRAFNEVDEDGSVPLVLVPSKRTIPAYFLIPQNAQAVMQCDGAHVAVLNAGRHSAGWRHRLVYVVNRQAVTYDFNVVACPTRDNVMVEVDITFVFSIVKADDFCYKLGAMHFNDLLHAVAEEAIRTLVRSIDHTAVYELRSSCSETLQNILNHTFNKFGVQFSSTTVKNVSLPPRISVSLENASKVDSQVEKHIKEHEYAMKKISDTSDLELKRHSVIEEEHITNLKSLLERTIIDGQKQISECKREGERAIIKAEQEAETRTTSALASLRDEQTKAKTEADRRVQQATAEKQNETRRIDQWSKEELMKSEQELTMAKNEFEIIKMKAGAKENENMKGTRAHEIELRQTAALHNLALNGRLVISGESGKKLLDQFTF